MLHRLLDEHDPSLVVLDAVASLDRAGATTRRRSVISRDLDLLKGRGITTVMTTLTHGTSQESSEVDISSLVDTWLLLRNHESNGERNRLLFVIKSRGSAHSNQVREFVLTDDGAELVDVYVGPDGVLTGSARVEQIGPGAPGPGSPSRETERRRQELASDRPPIRGPDRRPPGPARPPRRPSSSASSRPRTRAAHPASPCAQSLGRERSGDREGDARDDGVDESRRRSTPRHRCRRGADLRPAPLRRRPVAALGPRAARTCARSATSTWPVATRSR